jgi:hypothetical protein
MFYNLTLDKGAGVMSSGNLRGDGTDMEQFRAALQDAVGDLTGKTARWIVAGLVALDLVLLVTIFGVDRKIDISVLRYVGVSALIIGGLALTLAVFLGDCLQSVWLRLTDPTQRDQARRVSVRAALWVPVLGVLLLVVLPLAQRLNGS